MKNIVFNFFSTSLHELVPTVSVILVIKLIIYSTILFQNTDSFMNLNTTVTLYGKKSTYE